VDSPSVPGTSKVLARRLLCCGVAAGPMFVTVFLAEGAIRGGYRPLRHPVSSLALGSRGWIQTANFAMCAASVLGGAVGLASAGEPEVGRATSTLIGAAGAGLIASALFTTDPVSGYPPGTPDALTQPTRTGIAHNLSALPVFLGLSGAALVTARRSWRAGQHSFAGYSAGTGVGALTTLVLAGAGFGQALRLVNLAGLFQRISILTAFTWLSALSFRALRRMSSIAAPMD
jgi:hypothetical protein